MARNRRFSFVRSVIRVLFILFGAGVGNRHLAFSSQYVISDLGVNTSAIMPGNINNLGQTTGVADGGSFLCANGTFTYFTVFGTYGHTMDLNDHSQVTGWNLQTPRKGFRWSLASGAVDLGTLGGDTWGLGINDSGITVGTSTVIQGASQYMRAFRWETGNVAQLTLWQSGLQSQAFDINDNGVIVGEASNNIGTWRAVRWVNGIPENLGVMAGFTSSRAIAINNSGQIIVQSSDSSTTKTALWSNGVFSELPGQPSPFSMYALNNIGEVLGMGRDQSGVLRDYVYSPGSGFVDLSSLFTHSTGYSVNFFDGIDINDHGQILGIARQQESLGHRYRYVILTPVPLILRPSSYVVLNGSEATHNLAAFYYSDDQRQVIQTNSLTGFTSLIEMETTCPVPSPSKVMFVLESHTNFEQRRRFVELFNYNLAIWELLSVSSTPLSDGVVRLEVNTNANRFVDPLTQKMKARVSSDFPSASRTMARSFEFIDQAVWEIE